MVKFWGYVSRPILEILALKGPNLALMAKYITRGVESQKRPLFQSVLGTEHEYCLRIPNFDSLESNLAILDLNWAQIGPKLAQKGQKCIYRPREPNKTIFPHNLKSLSWLFIRNTKILVFKVYFGPRNSWKRVENILKTA